VCISGLVASSSEGKAIEETRDGLRADEVVYYGDSLPLHRRARAMERNLSRGGVRGQTASAGEPVSGGQHCLGGTSPALPLR
jgi:hypothetical protein